MNGVKVTCVRAKGDFEKPF